MMLRKSSVLKVGGYDESLDRAQDYDLWTRLVDVGLGGVPEIFVHASAWRKWSFGAQRVTEPSDG